MIFMPGSGGNPLLMKVFEAFEQRDIRWSTLPYPFSRGELKHSIDLLVAQTDLGDAQQTLMDLGFLPETAAGSRANRCFLAYISAADEWIRLRLVSQLGFGALEALGAEAVTDLLTRRHKTHKAAELDPADAFPIVLLHCLFENVSVGHEDVTRLQELAASARPEDLHAQTMERIDSDAEKVRALVSSAQSGDRVTLERLIKDLRTQAESRRPAGELAGPLQTLARSLRSALLHGRGLTVALLAPDGAGKSSVASALTDTLPVPVRVVYMGRARTSNRGRRQSVASGLVRQWRRHLTARYHRFRGRIVLFDRYTYDALLPPRNPNPARVARRWVFAHAVPAPDLVILLDAPAELMFQRKDEHPREFLEQRRRDYLELKSRLPEMVVVDASQSLEDVRRDVTHAIWTAYSQEHGKRAAHVPSPAAQGH